MGEPVFAFRIVIESEGQRRSYVTLGADLIEAAQAARGQIGSDDRIVGMEQLDQLLARPAATGEPVAVEEDAPVLSSPPKASVQVKKAVAVGAGSRRVTRRDQLLVVLRQHEGPVHLDLVARTLDITRGHADEVARGAVKAGLVERVGSRTGKVRLVEHADESSPPQQVEEAGHLSDAEPAEEEVAAAPRPTRRTRRSGEPSRIDQLVILLRERGGEVHISEIVEALDTTRGNADAVIRVAAQRGLVERVGSRTGRVRLITSAGDAEGAEGAEPAEAAEPAGVAPAAPAEVVRKPRRRAPRSDGTTADGETASIEAIIAPSSPSGPAPSSIEERTRLALADASGWLTAKQLAAALGCRPREVGNALALLVQDGQAQRRPGDGSPERPATYRIDARPSPASE